MQLIIMVWCLVSSYLKILKAVSRYKDGANTLLQFRQRKIMTISIPTGDKLWLQMLQDQKNILRINLKIYFQYSHQKLDNFEVHVHTSFQTWLFSSPPWDHRYSQLTEPSAVWYHVPYTCQIFVRHCGWKQVTLSNQPKYDCRFKD